MYYFCSRGDTENITSDGVRKLHASTGSMQATSNCTQAVNMTILIQKWSNIVEHSG